jgi:hypothetical protein
MSTLNITPEKIRQAANECPEAAKTLKTLFPEVFEDEFYDFVENEFVLDDRVYEDKYIAGKPLFIGMGWAPDGMRGKCLIVGDGYKMDTVVYQGRTVLYFKKMI